MSETSETKSKWTRTVDPGGRDVLMRTFGSRGVEYLEWTHDGDLPRDADPLGDILAALNQPAACGPGLTEEQLGDISNAATILRRHGYEVHVEALLKLMTAARDAKADTVTAERLRKAEALLESCWMVMDAFGGGGGSGKGNMRATMAAVDAFLGDPKPAIAEAEAALAQGGE